ncbi:MAG: alpha-L-fucosidase, partial [Planctomycetes bacterium]|nr:alpha-L-fucosidase [Planctomycetota bacterium]
MLRHALIILALATGLYAQVGPPAPLPPLPGPRHLDWQALEYYAFVHFNMNTFMAVELGDGREPADTFAPRDLDCRQWCAAFRDAGMKGVIITAKHHDGFCLWPSAQTTYSVAASSWRQGEGDILRELSAACREFGLKFGVYLSPWDRHHPDYGSARYNEVFKAQLEEVLTRYGDVFEVWFDGACSEGPNGKRQDYDWPGFVEVVRKHAPDAVIFSDAGPDVRWVGNEKGVASFTNWAPFNREEFHPGITDRNVELGTGHENGSHWVPAEADVSIRPSWFYHASENDELKTTDDLLSIWYDSVGSNANLLLNVPADHRGLIPEA